jgi:hypothetical protein
MFSSRHDPATMSRTRWRHRTAVLMTGLSTAVAVTLVAAPSASAALPSITPGDYYRITGGSSGLAIDVESSSDADDARVVQRPVDIESRSQDWRALQQPSGAYEFRNAKSGKCLVVYLNDKAAGAHATQYTCDGTAGQRWTLRAGEIDPTAGLQSVLSGHYIDVPANTLAPNTWLELQPGDEGGGPGLSQSFYMVRVDV